MKAIAIEFGKWLLSNQVTKCTFGTEEITYHPPEFKLLLGELIAKESEVWDAFITYLNCDDGK